MKSTRLIICLLFIFFAGMIAGDDLKNRMGKNTVQVEVGNYTSYPLYEVYYASEGTENWSENLLGQSAIEPWFLSTVRVPAGRYMLRAVYYVYGVQYYVEKTYDFKTGKSYSWPIEEDKEPFFAEAAYQYYDSYGYWDPYADYYPYGDYDPYGEWDPYGY